VTGQLSGKCKQAIPALTALGIKVELWLGEDDSISSARYQFAHANATSTALLQIAREFPAISGFNLDLETHAPFSTGDRLAYHKYLHDVTEVGANRILDPPNTHLTLQPHT
jgi:hypothetical protein